MQEGIELLANLGNEPKDLQSVIDYTDRVRKLMHSNTLSYYAPANYVVNSVEDCIRAVEEASNGDNKGPKITAQLDILKKLLDNLVSFCNGRR